MRQLLDFPEELLSYVFTYLVTGHGVESAIEARPTCRLFDRLIISAIWTTGALEAETRPRRCREELLTRILLDRTNADWIHRKYSLTSIVATAIGYLGEIYDLELDRGRDYVREACLAVARSRSWFLRRSMQYVIDPIHVMTTEFKDQYTVQERVLAFAAHLGLASIVERLIDGGVRDRETCFGSPLGCVAKHRDPGMARVYLNARLRRCERHGMSLKRFGHFHQSISPDSSVDHHRRDLDSGEYEIALKNAMSFGMPETVGHLVDASVEDNEWPKPDTRGQWHWLWYDTTQPKDRHRYNCILWYASLVGRTDVARFAVEQGANVNIASQSKASPHSTALHNAAARGNPELFRFLLDRGADIHLMPPTSPVYPYNRTRSLLNWAVRGGSVEIAKICFDTGAKMPPEWFNGSTLHPLLRCVQRDWLEMLKLLLKNGITCDTNTAFYRDLVVIARDHENDEIIDAVWAMDSRNR